MTAGGTVARSTSMTSVAPFKPRDAPPAPTPLSRAILRNLLIVAAVGVVIWVGHRLGRIVRVSSWTASPARSSPFPSSP
jgi:hypothetical protein